MNKRARTEWKDNCDLQSQNGCNDGTTTAMSEEARQREGVAGYNNGSNQNRPTTSQTCLSWRSCGTSGAMESREKDEMGTEGL